MRRKLLLLMGIVLCLCLCSCSSRDVRNGESSGRVETSSQTAESPDESEESDSNVTSKDNEGKDISQLSDKEPFSDDESKQSSRETLPLGVISGKRIGGSVLFPSEFVCTQPLLNCYQPESDYFGITSITVTIQDTRDPSEIILRYGTRPELGDADFHKISRGNREITAYVIGELDTHNTERLLQPEDRFYRHVLEFDESHYFVSFVYTIQGLENKEAEEQMLNIIDTFQLGSSDNERVAQTFDVWSDFGIMAPELFQNPNDLSAEDLLELYTYFCKITHTPVYEFVEESGQWREADVSDYWNLYAKAEDLNLFTETYFGQDGRAVSELLIENSQLSDSGMILIRDADRRYRRPHDGLNDVHNGLNDVFLLDSSVRGERITLELHYDYTRTAAVSERDSLDCTVTAEWIESGPVFKSCHVTRTVPASQPSDFIRTKTQLAPDILSRIDPTDIVDVVDAFYLGLGLDKQDYVVYQEGMVHYTLYTQITDSGSKYMGLPDLLHVPGYARIHMTNAMKDGSYQNLEDYILSLSTGQIVSLTHEEARILDYGDKAEQQDLLSDLFS